MNAASQGQIGSFNEPTHHIVTTQEQARFHDWDYTSPIGVQEEIVEFLTLQDENGPILPEMAGGCCSVL